MQKSSCTEVCKGIIREARVKYAPRNPEEAYLPDNDSKETWE